MSRIGTIQTRFHWFDQDHPEVYAEFERLALQGIAAGKRRISAKFLLELIRWEGRLGVCADGLNNEFTSRYARKFQQLWPAHYGVFETRELQAQ